MVLPPPDSHLGSWNVEVRLAQKEDLPGISALMARFDMYGEFQAEECVVAEWDGKLFGFARIELVGDQPYLRPIVVDPDSHGRGVGKALLKDILARNTSLLAIARGSAVGFYTRLGFQPVDWNKIYSPFRSECDQCPDLESCRPVPMIVRTRELPDEIP